MATESRHEELLETFGLDKTRKDMVILGALLKAQKKPTDFVDFETLREQLEKEEGSRKGKDPLIYRTLSKLEKDGFLKIDKGGHKHGYNSSIALLEKALARIVTQNLKEMEKGLREIDNEVTLLSEMNTDQMAIGLIDFSAGDKRIEKPVFAQGWDNILKLLDSTIWNNLKKGDVVRIKLEWLSQIDYLSSKRVLNIENALKKGIVLRALDHDRGENGFRPGMREIVKRFTDSGGIVEYKVFPRPDATYQFLSRNRDGIVLIVSESPLSATWLPRSGNVELVDNAIDSFDADFEQGTDLLQYKV
ncbi:MAG: hypothetical protein ACFFE2_11620 [Candidatus Thorarchaeota archaeon]